MTRSASISGFVAERCGCGAQPLGSARSPSLVGARPGVLVLRLLLWMAAAGLSLWLHGCASTGPAPIVDYHGERSGARAQARVPKGYYRVRKGDTLGGIALRRRVSVDQLIRWNGLRYPNTLYAGRVLRVTPPRGGRGRSPAPSRTTRAVRPAPAPAVPGSRASASSVDWVWPLRGPLVQRFRAGDPARSGLRIGCSPGQAVRVAAVGQVVYSGSGLKGYGNLIIVQHNKNYLSAYGFNRRLLATEGSSVARGQAVAECGLGPGGIPMLHFEVRRNGASVDPLLYLPPRG